MSKKQYLRLITYEDGFQVLTNNFKFDVFDIKLLYTCRWNIEVLFKELKFIFKIDHIIGNNYNHYFVIYLQKELSKNI